jgi:hypothetical protein
MTWKIALALSAVLASVAALAACAGDDCTRSQDHLSECQSSLSSSSSSSSGNPMTPACSGVYLCQAQCINNATCDEINGNLPAYTCCAASCEGGCVMNGNACTSDGDCCCGSCMGGKCAGP